MRYPKSIGMTIAIGPAFMAAVLLVAITVIGLGSSVATANPAIAKKTGESCASCHTIPPALNENGKKYKDSQKK
jgi:nitrate/TMAO reductase-like tetraheme cytochrome c subunit